MLPLLKKIKRQMIDEGRLGRYIVYALGEILLVVIGILIAIQINSWNQARIENAELEGYLQSIAENIRADLDKLDYQRRQQERLFAAVLKMTQTIDNKETYDAEDFALFGRAISLMARRQPIRLDTSAYESLKSSGYLSKLRGDDIEELLYDYYDSTNQVNDNGPWDQNNLLGKLLFEFTTTDWEIEIPQLYANKPVTDQNIVDELRVHYNKLLEHPLTKALLIHQRESTLYTLSIWYRQSVMASHFIELVETNSRIFSDEMRASLEALNIDERDIGDPDVYVDGVLAPFFDIGVASSGGVTDWLRAEDTQLNFDYPAGQSWGSVFLYVSTSDRKEKQTKDYSTYRKIVLELKGAKGNERLTFGLKDNTDPDDGSEQTVPLTLGPDWQQYEFELTDFTTADLSNLYVVALFSFEGGEQVSINVRNIQFID